MPGVKRGHPASAPCGHRATAPALPLSTPDQQRLASSRQKPHATGIDRKVPTEWLALSQPGKKNGQRAPTPDESAINGAVRQEQQAKEGNQHHARNQDGR